MPTEIQLRNLNRRGRKPGSLNKATLERQALSKAVAKAIKEHCVSEDVAKLSAADVLRNIMHMCYAAGDLNGARTAAAELIPYTHARVSPTAPETVLAPV